ncbi:Fe-S cluster assembly factor HCF101, chloroplastic [Tanacetum coccineum]
MKVPSASAENDALKALSQIIDPDFGTNIVSCGFVKDLDVDDISGEFEKQANEVVAALPCVQNVKDFFKHESLFKRKKKMKWAHNADVALKTATLPILTNHYKFDGSECWSDIIRPKGFLSSVLLWLVIIVAVVGVGVTVVVVVESSSVVKLSFVIT